jgi:hypothetical protein
MWRGRPRPRTSVLPPFAKCLAASSLPGKKFKASLRGLQASEAHGFALFQESCLTRSHQSSSRSYWRQLHCFWVARPEHCWLAKEPTDFRLKRIRETISADLAVEKVGELLTMQLGPEQALLTVGVKFRRVSMSNNLNLLSLRSTHEFASRVPPLSAFLSSLSGSSLHARLRRRPREALTRSHCLDSVGMISSSSLSVPRSTVRELLIPTCVSVSRRCRSSTPATA